ncbi:MAG TPA: hypothetical protein VMB66_12855 [Candidatus Acidoferrales bacterium]|nr:hypothetical protein [Candidatus Acidoferrales bacterium]
MAYCTAALNPTSQLAKQALHDKHYLRKHGRDAYYGQANRV